MGENRHDSYAGTPTLHPPVKHRQTAMVNHDVAMVEHRQYSHEEYGVKPP